MIERRKAIEDLLREELDKEKDRIRHIVVCTNNPQLTEEEYRQILEREIWQKSSVKLFFCSQEEASSIVLSALRRALRRDEWIYARKRGGDENGY